MVEYPSTSTLQSNVHTHTPHPHTTPTHIPLHIPTHIASHIKEKGTISSTQSHTNTHTYTRAQRQTVHCDTHFVGVSNGVERNGQPAQKLSVEEGSRMEIHPQEPK